MARRSMASGLSELNKRVDEDPLLTEEDRAQIKEKAREHVKAERRKKAEAKALAEAIREEEISYNPFEQTEDVTIVLAPYVAAKMNNSSFISLDGRMFFHGVTYTVPYSVARSLEDIMARGWEHEREIKGERRKADVSRRPLQPTIAPGQEGMPARTLNTRSSLLNSETQV